LSSEDIAILSQNKKRRRFLSLFEVPFRRIAISSEPNLLLIKVPNISKYLIVHHARSLQTIRITKNYLIFEANNGSNCRPTITQVRKSATVTWQNGPFNSPAPMAPDFFHRAAGRIRKSTELSRGCPWFHVASNAPALSELIW